MGYVVLFFFLMKSLFEVPGEQSQQLFLNSSLKQFQTFYSKVLSLETNV